MTESSPALSDDDFEKVSLQPSNEDPEVSQRSEPCLDQKIVVTKVSKGDDSDSNKLKLEDSDYNQSPVQIRTVNDRDYARKQKEKREKLK